MNRPSASVHALSILILTSSMGFAAASTHDPGRPVGAEALDWAFKFASAIKADPKDMAREQANVVDDLITAGRLDEAVKKAENIDGWRRGAAFADIAARMVEAGRADEAKNLLARAEQLGQQVEGWEGPRVQAHVAQALAAMGDTSKAEEVAGKLAQDDRQYAGRSVATTAMGHARAGNFEAAMSSLKTLDKNDDIDVGWWRTAGYLSVAKQEKLTASQRRKALDAARGSAEAVSDWRKIEGLQSVAEEYRRIGATPEAKACLKTAETALEPLPTKMTVRAPLMANLARAWAKMGDKERARRLLSGAGAHVDEAMLTERPAIWGNLAASYAAIGDEATAWRTFVRALKETSELQNARPRALSVVSICRAMSKTDLPMPPETRTTLESLYAGLRDPW